MNGTRRHILVLAYSISPVRGSEYAVAWDYVKNMSLSHDLTVLYGLAGDHMGDFDEMRDAAVPGVTFVAVAPGLLSRILNLPNRMGFFTFSFYLAYRFWHRTAAKVARSTITSQPVDVIHYLCPIGYREPGYLWSLGRPYIWGPIGGMNLRPARIFWELDWREGIKTALRNVLNWIQFRTSSRLSRALRGATVLIANTRENADLIEKVHGRVPLLLPENGIAPELLVDNPSHETRHSALRLLWVGRIDTAKALDLLLDALGHIPNVALQLTVIGDGPRRAALQARSEASGLQGKVRFAGRLSREAALQEFRRADVHVLTSLAEAHSTVLWEAMAAGVPTIAFDHCGMHDSICVQCGIRVPLSDRVAMARDLATAIGDVAADRARLGGLSQGAVRCAHDRRWELRRMFWDNAYEAAIERHLVSAAGPNKPEA